MQSVGNLTKISNILKSYVGTHYAKTLKKMEVVSAGDGDCTCELLMTEEHMNIMGRLHGGCIATIVDVVTFLALSTKSMNSASSFVGVSAGINISYLNPTYAGETLVIHGKVLKTGKHLAFMTAELVEKSTNKTVANGQQTGFLTYLKPNL